MEGRYRRSVGHVGKRLVFSSSPCIRVSSRHVLSRSSRDKFSLRRALSSAILFSSTLAWAASSLICIVALGNRFSPSRAVRAFRRVRPTICMITFIMRDKHGRARQDRPSSNGQHLTGPCGFKPLGAIRPVCEAATNGRKPVTCPEALVTPCHPLSPQILWDTKTRLWRGCAECKRVEPRYRASTIDARPHASPRGP